MPEDKNILVNPTGRFVIGGPDGDTGLTGRKLLSTTTAVMHRTAEAPFGKRRNQGRPLCRLYAALFG